MQSTKSHSVSVQGIDLHYETCGAGPPLLLLHGFTGCSRDWEHAGGDRLARAYRLIMPDARGHGLSTGGAEGITHRQCARDMASLLDELAIGRCPALGVSMGANVLLHMASAAPERFSALVLVSATMYFPEPARRIMRGLPDEPSPEDWPSLRARHRHGDAQIRALWRAQRALAESADDVNFTAQELARIRAPTLVIAGDRDPLYPTDLALELQRSIPGAQLWVVPGAGHSPVFLDRAPAFSEAVSRFLAQNDLDS